MADTINKLCSDCILILLYVDDISMWYQEDATIAAIEVKATIFGIYKITNLGLPSRILGIDISRKENGTGTVTAINLCWKAFITKIL